MQFVRVLVAYLKLGWVGVYTCLYLARLFLLRPFLSAERYQRLGHLTIYQWARTTMFVIGARIRVHGQLPTHGTLLVANHITYVDPPLLLSLTPCTMLAKAEVAKYPVIGPGAQAVGILFVKREAEGSRTAAQKAIADGLQAGRVVGIFPEGTTSPDGVVQAFRPGSFKAAVSVGAPVVPVAITYTTPNLAWIGAESLAPHFIRCHSTHKVTVDVWVGPTLVSDDPEYLREQAETWIRSQVEAHSVAPARPLAQG